LLSLDDILDVGVQITREVGLGALSVQAVADRLGVSGPAIYHWVRNRAALKQLVAGRVISTIEASESSHAAPADRLREVLLVTREGLRQHPGVAEYWIAQSPPPSEGLRTIDTVIGLLAEMGLSPRDAVRAFTALYTYTMGHLLLPSPDSPVRSTSQPSKSTNTESYPNLASAFGELAELDSEEEFHYGLDLMLNSLETG
jgi:AcrR family transcriptional regulator